MQPQQPVYGPPVVPGPAPGLQPPANPNNPYGFITDPTKPTRRLPFNGGSKITKIVLTIAAIFIILLLLIGLKNILSGEKINKASLISVAQDQTELLHLSSGGVSDAVSQSVQNFSITTQLSVTSQQTSLLAYLKTHGVKGNTKTLMLKQSSSIDAQLKAANAASTFNPTYASIMQSGLTVYQKDLKTAYTLNAGAKARALLNTDYSGASLLLKQLSSADTGS